MIITHWNICSCISDKMGIKTTVQEMVSRKQNMSLPDPVTHADFRKCKCVSVCTWVKGFTHSSSTSCSSQKFCCCCCCCSAAILCSPDCFSRQFLLLIVSVLKLAPLKTELTLNYLSHFCSNLNNTYTSLKHFFSFSVISHIISSLLLSHDDDTTISYSHIL